MMKTRKRWQWRTWLSNHANYEDEEHDENYDDDETEEPDEMMRTMTMMHIKIRRENEDT